MTAESNLIARIEAAITSRFQTFDCAGIEIDMRPVTAMEGLLIVREFPVLRKVLFGGGEGITDETMFDLILGAGPEAIAAFIATAAGAGRDPKARETFMRMPDDSFFEAIVNAKAITMPEGPGPFFGKIQKLGIKLGMVEEEAKAEAEEKVKVEAEAKATAAAGKRVRKAA